MITVLDLARLLGLVSLPATGLILWRRRVPPLRSAAILASVVYLCVLVAVVLGPLPVDGRLIAELRTEGAVRANLVPLRTIGLVLDGPVSVAVRQMGGNLLLLAPLGFLLPALAGMDRCRRACTAIFAVSLVIETAQFVVSVVAGFAYKVFDVDDLLLNTLGGLLGWLVFKVATSSASKWTLEWFRAVAPGRGDES